MLSIHPQLIKNAKGKNAFILISVKEFEMKIDELETSEDVRIYDEAKKNDKGKRILLSEYLKQRKLKNG